MADNRATDRGTEFSPPLVYDDNGNVKRIGSVTLAHPVPEATAQRWARENSIPDDMRA